MTTPQPPGVPCFFPGVVGYPDQTNGNGVTNQLNTQIRDPFTFLLQKPIFRAHRAASQTVSSGHQWIVWDTVDEDTYSGGNAGSSIYTVQATGKYLVSALVTLSGTGATGLVLIPAVAVNGSSPTGQGGDGWEGVCAPMSAGVSTIPKGSSGVWLVHANLNDTIQIDMWYSGESSITATDTTAGWQPRVEMVWAGA